MSNIRQSPPAHQKKNPGGDLTQTPQPVIEEANPATDQLQASIVNEGFTIRLPGFIASYESVVYVIDDGAGGAVGVAVDLVPFISGTETVYTVPKKYISTPLLSGTSLRILPLYLINGKPTVTGTYSVTYTLID